VQLINNYTSQTIFVKDLSRLGRPLEKTIIVDNLRENFRWQPANGIEITTWYCDENDQELTRIDAFLKKLAKRQCKDVRIALEEY
jgi:TFIIF-interacting CTD phosphatase-like protein